MANPIPARTSQPRTLSATNLKRASKDDILQQIFTQDVEIIDQPNNKLSLKINGESVELKPVFEKMCEKRHWFGKTLTRGAVYLALTLHRIKEGPTDIKMKFSEVFIVLKTFLNKFDVELPNEKDSLARFEKYAMDFEMQHINTAKTPLVHAYHSLSSQELNNKNFLDEFKVGTPYERMRILKELKKAKGFPSCESLCETKKLALQNPQVNKEFEAYFEHKIAKEGLGTCLDDLSAIRTQNPQRFQETIQQLNLKKIISETFEFKLSSFLKPKDIIDYVNASGRVEVLQDLLFTIDCSAAKTQRALATAIRLDEFSDFTLSEKLVAYMGTITWTDPHAMNDIMLAVQEKKFNFYLSLCGRLLDDVLTSTQIVDKWLMTFGENILEDAVIKGFASHRLIMKAIVRMAPQIVNQDKKLQHLLINAVSNGYFGTTNVPLFLIPSLAEIKWVDEPATQLLLAKALCKACAPIKKKIENLVTEVNWTNIENLVTAFNWTTPEAQEEVALALYLKGSELFIDEKTREILLTWSSPTTRAILAAIPSFGLLEGADAVKQWTLSYPVKVRDIVIERPSNNIKVIYTQQFYDRSGFYQQLSAMKGIEKEFLFLVQDKSTSESSPSKTNKTEEEATQNASVKKSREITLERKHKEIEFVDFKEEKTKARKVARNNPNQSHYKLEVNQYRFHEKYLRYQPRGTHYIDFKKNGSYFVMMTKNISDKNVKKLTCGNYTQLWDSLITDDNFAIYQVAKDHCTLEKMKDVSVNNPENLKHFPVFMQEVLKEFHSKKIAEVDSSTFSNSTLPSSASSSSAPAQMPLEQPD